ncbi:protein of unknown function [Methylorubrum extorquens]|uniref:Uncharacterized protein n=1 Tax=Methylorubrum extorquens TaxID=408 RepID=A0A2N9AVL3_METEX|nr:protein of unknown function [Methylorubrum extorquens]
MTANASHKCYPIAFCLQILQIGVSTYKKVNHRRTVLFQTAKEFGSMFFFGFYTGPSIRLVYDRRVKGFN